MTRRWVATGALVAGTLVALPAAPATADIRSCGLGAPTASTRLADDPNSTGKARLTVSVSGADAFSFGYSFAGGATGPGGGEGYVPGFPSSRTVILETGKGQVISYVDVLASYRGLSTCRIRHLVDRTTVR